MIKTIIIQDFFSFRGENRIELNEGLNLLLGINYSMRELRVLDLKNSFKNYGEAT